MEEVVREKKKSMTDFKGLSLYGERALIKLFRNEDIG